MLTGRVEFFSLTDRENSNRPLQITGIVRAESPAEDKAC
jgi:hypothetical protein